MEKLSCAGSNKLLKTFKPLKAILPDVKSTTTTTSSSAESGNIFESINWNKHYYLTLLWRRYWLEVLFSIWPLWYRKYCKRLLSNSEQNMNTDFVVLLPYIRLRVIITVFNMRMNIVIISSIYSIIPSINVPYVLDSFHTLYIRTCE